MPLQIGGLSIIAAGSYVEENTEVPASEVWAGNPARKLRDLKPQVSSLGQLLTFRPSAP